MNYDSIDLMFTEDGDFEINDIGDLSSTEQDRILSIQQEIFSTVQSYTGDWSVHPPIGANLRLFIGEPNTRENAKRIESNVKNAIIGAGVIKSSDLEVNVNALGIYSVMIEIIVRADPTIYNSVVTGIVMNIFFDSSDGTIMWTPVP